MKALTPVIPLILLMSCGGDDYTGEWSSAFGDEIIRIDALDPACELVYIQGDSSVRFIEDSREYRVNDSGNTNTVIYCHPAASDAEYSVMISIVDCTADTMWVRTSDIETGFMNSSDTFIR